MELTWSGDEIIVGTNEEFILGYELLYENNDEVKLEPIFSHHAHIGRVKQVVVCKKYLVTGSTDEFIKIFDLHSRKEIGSLNIHQGTINCLVYHESGFLFSASDDGIIGIIDIKNLKVRKELKGHNAPVTGFAVHPSGKLGLSISKDRRVMTWDLMKGKRAYVGALKKAGEIIKWSPDGSHYLISCSNLLNIYSLEHGNIVHTIDFKSNIYCFCHLTSNLIVIGGEKKTLILYNLESQTEVVQWEAHDSRAKCLLLLDSGSKEVIQFASASSDGFIKIWVMNTSKASSQPQLIGNINTKSRIICMALKSKSTTNILSNPEQTLNNLSSQDKETLSLKKKNKKLKQKKKDLSLKTNENTSTASVNKPNKVLPVKNKTKKIDKSNSKSESKNNEDKLRNVQKTVRFKKKVKKKFIQSNK
ncbi:p21-activated protein kinase-interacting protein 1-like, partial [Armadillidium nasatum]